jgi:hypothetical protein
MHIVNMSNSIIEQIEKTPIWSFYQLMDVEGGECMEISLDCSLNAELVDNSLVVLVTPLDPFMSRDFDFNQIENLVKQEIWNKFKIIT